MSAPDVNDEPLAERVARICLYLAVALVPFMTTSGFLSATRLGPHFVDGTLPKLVVLQALIFAGLAAWGFSFVRAERSLRWHPVLWIGVAYVAWTALSAAMGASVVVGIIGQHGRLQGLLAIATYFAALFLALQVIDSSARVRNVARVVAITGAVLAGYGLLQSAGLDPLTWSVAEFDRRMAFATFGNPDLLGGYLIAPLGVSLGLFFSARWERERSLFGACGVLIVAAIVATFVRGAWLAAVVTVAVFAIVAWRARVRPSRNELWWLGGAAAALVLVIGASAVLGGSDTNVFQRVAAGFQTDRGSVGARLIIWETALRAVPDTWLLGEGPDQFMTAFTRHEDPRSIAIAGSTVFADNAHNVLLQLAVTVGIPGALLFVALIAMVVVFSVPFWLPRGGDRRLIVFSGICSAVIGYGAYLLSGLEQPAATAVLWILLAALLSPAARTIAPSSCVARWATSAVTFMLALAIIGHGTARLFSENAYSRASTLTTPLPAAIRLAERSVRLAPWEPEYRRGSTMVMRRLVDLGMDSGLAMSPEAAVGAGEDQAAAAIRITPSDFRNPSVLSGLYLSAASIVSTDYAGVAADAAREAIRLRPASPDGYNQLALAEARGGDQDAAVAAARRAVELWDGYADGWLVLGLLLEQSGETEEAVAAYGSALEVLPPGDPRVPAVQGALRELE